MTIVPRIMLYLLLGASVINNTSAKRVVIDNILDLPSATTPLLAANPNQSTRNLPFLREHATENIWDVISTHLYLYKVLDVNNKRVQVEINNYLKNPKSFTNTLAAAQPFIYYIYQQTKERGLPAEIALLPFVESNYRPTAYSPVGAAGLWQFMNNTSGDYGIVENWWYDGRLDVLASTKAALTYFTYLSQRFHNDWPLALAAYNSGEGTVQNAMRKSKSTNFWDLHLPKETRDYVPRLLAITEIIRNSDRYNIELPFIPNTPFFGIVNMEEEISLHTAAHLAGVAPALVHALNPGYRRETTSPVGPLRLLLPVTALNTFKDNLKAATLNHRHDFQLVNWRYYTIHSGDSLESIAAGFNTTVPALKANNPSLAAQIRPGSALKIPEATTTSNDLISLASQTPKKANTTISQTQATQLNYYVSPQDTLASIAKTYNVSPEDIKQWNNLKSDQALVSGMRLLIWEPVHHIQKLDIEFKGVVTPNLGTDKATAKEVFFPPPSSRPKTSTRSNNANYYTVQVGDTLSDIATMYGLDLAKLKAVNHLKNDSLDVGQRLLIPR